jgi:hypothetical protein
MRAKVETSAMPQTLLNSPLMTFYTYLPFTQYLR